MPRPAKSAAFKKAQDIVKKLRMRLKKAELVVKQLAKVESSIKKVISGPRGSKTAHKSRGGKRKTRTHALRKPGRPRKHSKKAST